MSSRQTLLKLDRILFFGIITALWRVVEHLTMSTIVDNRRLAIFADNMGLFFIDLRAIPFFLTSPPLLVE